jgi:signal transduction histidine kinase
MAVTSQRGGKLAYRILGWFLLISLLPMLFVGKKLIEISQTSLRKQTLEMQVSLAVGFADTAYKYVTTFENVLKETSGLEDFASMNPVKQQQYLNRIMQVHLAVLELSVIDPSGTEIIRTGRFLSASPEMRKFGSEEFFTEAMARGQYIGKLERFQGLYPALTIAVAVMDQKSATPKPVGVLTGKISLNGLSSMLSMEFPPTGQSAAAVVATDGFLIAHSNPKEVYKPDARLSDKEFEIVTTQMNDKGGGEIALPDGSKVLGAYAEVKDLNWLVYVRQPLEIANQTAAEMQTKIIYFLVGVFLAVLVASWFVADVISQPIRVLREAADRLGKGQWEDLPEVMMTNDEIGDLAQTFLTMSESLREKTGEIIHAKQELEKFNKSLKDRVAARERELRSAQDELIKQERLAAIGQMASVVGHEIRNPLAVINNSIYFIKTKLGATLEADQKITKHIKIIESEIQQANGIINEILTYSRQRELKPEKVFLNAWLEELLSVYPFPPHIQVEKTFTPVNPTVEIDVVEMQQALRNLIGNGVEVMPQSGAVKVRTAMAEGGYVVIEIGDTGPGIPPEIRDKIFSAFFTTKARGTGLGLAVVKKVMDRHGGRVELDSAVGQGTTFRLFIPVAQLPPGKAGVRA